MNVTDWLRCKQKGGLKETDFIICDLVENIGILTVSKESDREEHVLN